MRYLDLRGGKAIATGAFVLHRAILRKTMKAIKGEPADE
jgi:hypothetical protein